MKILVKFESVIEGLASGQLPKFFENLSQQLNFPLNLSRLKTGVVEGRILGIDDAGRFIAAKGSRLKNGDIATISNYGTSIAGCSKVVPAEAGATQRGLLESLANQFKTAGHDVNIDRMKTGTVAGKPYGVDDKGNYIFTSLTEKLPNGDLGTVSTIGKVEHACSKVIPKTALQTMRITRKPGTMSI